MSEPVCFQVGPLTAQIEGDHPIADWARHAFEPLRCDAEPAVRFRMVAPPVHPCGPEAVGDKRISVDGRSMSFRGRRLEARIEREGGGDGPATWDVAVAQRDRRPLWLRSLADPEEAWKMWLSHGASLRMHLLKEFAYRVAPLALQCALLERGAALIHASAFALEGRGVVLPAWGGVGKSAMVSRAVLHGAAEFLADDLAVVDQAGRCHLYTLPIHLYAHQLGQDALLRQRTLAGCSPAVRRQWPIAHTLSPKRAVRWVSPQEVFGREKLTGSARIERAVVMFRTGVDGFRWIPCSAEQAARPCVGTILQEIHAFAERLAGAEAGWRPGPLPSLGWTHQQLHRVYSRAFAEAQCAQLLIPRRTGTDELAAYLRSQCSLLGAALPG